MSKSISLVLNSILEKKPREGQAVLAFAQFEDEPGEWMVGPAEFGDVGFVDGKPRWIITIASSYEILMWADLSSLPRRIKE